MAVVALLPGAAAWRLASAAEDRAGRHGPAPRPHARRLPSGGFSKPKNKGWRVRRARSFDATHLPERWMERERHPGAVREARAPSPNLLSPRPRARMVLAGGGAGADDGVFARDGRGPAATAGRDGNGAPDVASPRGSGEPEPEPESFGNRE